MRIRRGLWCTATKDLGKTWVALGTYMENDPRWGSRAYYSAVKPSEDLEWTMKLLDVFVGGCCGIKGCDVGMDDESRPGVPRQEKESAMQEKGNRGPCFSDRHLESQVKTQAAASHPNSVVQPHGVGNLLLSCSPRYPGRAWEIATYRD